MNPVVSSLAFLSAKVAPALERHQPTTWRARCFRVLMRRWSILRLLTSIRPQSSNRALRYDRTPAVVLLVLVPLVSWIWIVVMARDMYGPMTGRQCVDDDRAMGCTASAAALGNVGGHDDRNDAPVCLTDVAAVRLRRATIRTRIGSAPAVCARGWLSHGLGRVQSGSNRASAIACGVPACFADDGNHQSRGRWRRSCSSQACIS